MSRPLLLAFLLLVLIITSQFEWKEQFVGNTEASPSVPQKQQQTPERDEPIKEKIILSQEKNIQKLNELVKSLQKQLLQCQNSTSMEKLIELERPPVLED